MSNSLTINTPNIVKQNTPLRNVPSGSTTESDYSVKYVPQTLTEAQQAQARQNIGAGTPQVQADWNQTNTSAPDYIKNKPEITPGGGATINEFVYTRTGEPGSYTGVISCTGYEPQEGDLMTISFQGPFYTDYNPVTLNNGTTNPTVTLLNAEVNATDYDEINPEVNTKWTVRLTKVNNAWVAVNVSTQVQADWNTSDTTLPSYIKNKPAMATDEIPEDREGTITIYSNVDTDLHSDHINEVVKFYQNGILYTGTYTNNNIPIKKGKNVLVTTSWTPNGYRFNDTNSDTVYNIVVNAGQNDFLDGTYNGIVNIIITSGKARESINNGRAQGPNVRYYILRNNATGRYLQRGQTVFVDYPFFNRYNSFQANPQWNPSATNTGTAYVPRSRKEEFERGMAASISDPTELENALSHVKYYDFLTFDPNYNVSMITL